ncbi:MAG: STAS domain-containing protein [Pseudomonadota bacterium]
MDLNATTVGDTLLVTVDADRIDAAVAIRFKDGVREIVQNGPARIVLDLSRVDFVDSSGLGAVVAAMKLVGADRKLELAGLTPTVAKVFRLTRMENVFTIYPTVSDATEVADTAQRTG